MQTRRSIAWFILILVAWMGISLHFVRLAPAGADDAEAAKTDKPVPMEKTNCVRCHLKAGRALTEAVHTFSLSVHDFAGLSCNDCHGGNTEDDSKAHEVAFGFIGTKMSAHLKKCRSCHEDQSTAFAKSPHFWDHDKQLNPKFPLCVDCHGNHDVGNPPADFTLTAVCADCHKDYATRFPAFASLTEEDDKLWTAIRDFRKANGKKAMSDQLREEWAAVRTKTGEAIHSSGKLSPADVKSLNDRIAGLRNKLSEKSSGKAQ